MPALLARSLLVLLLAGVLRAQEGAPTPTAEAMLKTLREAWRSTPDDDRAMPVENMTLPLDHHPNLRVRALLKAGKALVPNEGFVRASDVVIELYDELGKLEGLFVADHCIVDRATSSGYCEGKVRIERMGVRITGVDMLWLMEERNVRILSQAEVRTDRFIEGMGDLFK